MEFWIKAAQLLLSLSILVVLHEFGHFIPARLFKTRVEKFYLFFNPWFSIFKRKVGETEWGIGWLPLGGYVKIAGMIDESMDKEQLAKPAEEWEFRSKKAWQRLIIMVGGVVVNLIVGVLIYILVVFAYGEEKIPPTELKAGVSIHPYLQKYGLKSGDNILAINGEFVTNINDINKEIMLRGGRELSVLHANGSKEIITLPEDIDYELFENGAMSIVNLRSSTTTVDSVLEDSPAFEAGLLKGDRIVKINAKPVKYFDEIQLEFYNSRSKKAKVEIIRNDKLFIVEPDVKEDGTIGFMPNSKVDSLIDHSAIKTINYGFGESIGKGMSKGVETLSDYISQFKFVFTEKGATSIGGFGAIGSMFPPKWDWKAFWLNTAFLSIVLAFMNILPIPALDGGHVVFLLYEIITGKEAPQKVLEYAQYVGLFLLLGLLLYANGNDIFRWLFGA
jgi:regulator of sigma E protease